MTDYESQEAFAEWALRKYGWTVVLPEVAREVWQASAEYHTERERERCAGIVYNLLQGDYSAAHAVRLIEEPKP